MTPKCETVGCMGFVFYSICLGRNAWWQAGPSPRAINLMRKYLLNHTMSQVGQGGQSLFGVDNGEQVRLELAVM